MPGQSNGNAPEDGSKGNAGFLGVALVAFGAAFMLVARRNEESFFETAANA